MDEFNMLCRSNTVGNKLKQEEYEEMYGEQDEEEIDETA